MKEWFESLAGSVRSLGSTIADNIGYTILFFAIMAGMIALAAAVERIINKRRGISENTGYRINKMVIMAMLAAIAGILTAFDFPLWFAPGFYKLDFSELPVIIGAFALGPVAGVIIEAVKILLNLIINGTVTAFVGELANFCMGCSFVIPAAIIYYCRKTRKNAIIGLAAGIAVAVVFGSLMNAFVLLPTYARVFFKSDSLDAIIGMGADKNGAISGLTSFILLAVAPFNLLKYGLVSVVTMLIYKPISHLLKKQA